MELSFPLSLLFSIIFVTSIICLLSNLNRAVKVALQNYSIFVPNLNFYG